jgi:hypothetical protein
VTLKLYFNNLNTCFIYLFVSFFSFK